MVETDINKPLGLPGQGKIAFTIKADDTEDNNMIHNSFKEFCRLECDNNYTWGLKVLIKNYESDFKYEMLYEEINKLKVELLELQGAKEQPQQQEEENKKAF